MDVINYNIGLPNNCNDKYYLKKLKKTIKKLNEDKNFKPDIIFYNAV